jgi:hypothetical protein
MKTKHGLSQYRLNHAKDYAKLFLENINKIELMFNMSIEGLVDENIAESYISGNIEQLDQGWEEFKSYIKQREDMR